jgi:thioredoxin-dependent peroxiredoxin
VTYFAASTDDAETNKKFAESLQLDYPILSDPDRKTAGAYGVLAPQGAYARRHTVYIGADGRILDVDREVKPGSAGADVAARLESLGVAKKK